MKQRKYVLIACEESQVECVAFRNRGYIAYSCDLQKCSGGHPEWHILGDVLPLLPGECSFSTEDGRRHRLPGRWDLIVAHPPCTYLTRASAVRMYIKPGVIDLERFRQSQLAREFFMACLNADAKFVAVENPVPMKIVNLPKPSCYVQPFWYGHPYSKKTLFWLRGLPPLMPSRVIADYIPYVQGKKGDSERAKRFGVATASTSKQRSKSFPGIAQAMVEQWGPLI